MDVLLLALAFVLIVAGAVGFTNAVEWLGHRLNLGAGAVGALLAAVGTALPESLIPLVALAGGRTQEREDIAIGAILGAPFLLGTLAMLLVAGSSWLFRRRRGEKGSRVEPHRASTLRDMRFFLALFPVALIVGAVGAPTAVRVVVAALLLAAYGVYARMTVHGGGQAESEEDLKALFFDPSKRDPPTVAQIALQFLVSLAAIIGGAELFVREVEGLAESLGIGLLVTSLILAPLATELPEKVNSVLWVREGKDALALGNITGAMVFQAAVPVAIGLVLTDWDLPSLAIAAGLVGLLGGAVTVLALRTGDFHRLPAMAWAGLLAAYALYASVS